MGTISRYNSVQFENLDLNKLAGVTLVYKSVNKDGDTHFSGLNFAGDEFTPADGTQDEIFRVWKNVVATFWNVKAVEAGLREDNGGIASKLRSAPRVRLLCVPAMERLRNVGMLREAYGVVLVWFQQRKTWSVRHVTSRKKSMLLQKRLLMP